MSPVYATATPHTGRLPGIRTCWRCGIEFRPTRRSLPTKPCRDCLPWVDKPADGWDQPKENDERP